jgi:hypothetical protein
MMDLKRKAKVEKPQKTRIVPFKVTNPTKCHYHEGKRAKLINRNRKKIPCKIMHYKNGEGSMMLPESYFNQFIN